MKSKWDLLETALRIRQHSPADFKASLTGEGLLKLMQWVDKEHDRIAQVEDDRAKREEDRRINECLDPNR